MRSLLLAEFAAGSRSAATTTPACPMWRRISEQLIQAVLNIARNAAQALKPASMAEGASLLCGLGSHTPGHARPAALPAGSELQIIDNGPGVPEQIRERIFFPLVSGREGGSGLGLTLAQTYVQ